MDITIIAYEGMTLQLLPMNWRYKITIIAYEGIANTIIAYEGITVQSLPMKV